MPSSSLTASPGGLSLAAPSAARPIDNHVAQTPRRAVPSHATALAFTPSSAATRVASIYEIVREICRILIAPPRFYYGRPYPGLLCSLTRVSRFVSDVALDVLWEKQTSLAPLFQTIPRVARRLVKWRRYYDGWEFLDSDEPDSEIVKRKVLKIPCRHQLDYDRESESGNAVDDDGAGAGIGDGVSHEKACNDDIPVEGAPVEDVCDSDSNSEASDDDRCLEDDCDPDELELTDAEYERFTHYARRIRVLDAQRREPWRSRKIFVDNALLFAALRRGPILPRVRSIRLHKEMDLLIHGCHIVDIDTPSLVGYSALVVRDFESFHASPLCPLTHVRDMTLPPDPELDVLAHLRHLPLLEQLHFGPVRWIYEVEDSCPPPAGFYALRSLSISGIPRLEHVQIILSRMSSKPLRLRSFSHRNTREMATSADHTSACDLFRELRARLDVDYLEQLTVSTACCMLHEPAGLLLKDLCAFPNVRVANIRLAHSPGIDVDEVLDVITSAWPGLEKIFIRNNPNESFRYGHLDDPESGTRRHGSLAGLVPLALRCPRLSVLSVPLRIPTESQAIPRPLEPIAAHAFAARQVRVDVRKGDAGYRVDEVAAYVASVFPSLLSISACDAGSDVMNRWKKVEQKVKHGPEETGVMLQGSSHGAVAL
ncbi:hypothetical protein BD626DRAFT_516434 [Schizophyllum amplum]|uniref:Uncharacterized protein n=1 Tax=Schizophyllum amplum TaxID=97359 RepID=A0A550BX38_9AGAR|nr:hypothetical protein BD626DRAFT_516434 [Auriculariopsis ampla]